MKYILQFVLMYGEFILLRVEIEEIMYGITIILIKIFCDLCKKPCNFCSYFKKKSLKYIQQAFSNYANLILTLTPKAISKQLIVK